MAVHSDHGTLVANTVTTVTLTSNPHKVEVVNRSGSGTIYFTVGQSGVTAPTVAGDDTFVAVAGERVTVNPRTGLSVTTVKLISATADEFSVVAV